MRAISLQKTFRPHGGQCARMHRCRAGQGWPGAASYIPAVQANRPLSTRLLGAAKSPNGLPAGMLKAQWQFRVIQEQ